MQYQYKKLIKWIIGAGVLFIILLIPEICIVEKITSNTNETKFYFLIIAFITILFYIGITMIKYKEFDNYRKEAKQIILEETKEKLTSEFKEVQLNDYTSFLNGEFDCLARVDDDGKIICKVYADFEIRMESYEEFIREFHFVE